MIARVTFARGTARLGDDLRWACADPAVASALNALASAEDDSPSRGRWWVAHVAAVASALGGTAEVAGAPDRPGRVY